MKKETKRLSRGGLTAVWGFGIAAFVGCTTTAPKTEITGAASFVAPLTESREPASVSLPFAPTPFGKQMAAMKLKNYFANLHAHHFMGVVGSKKNPLSLADALAEGTCKAGKATFPMDDGRPCRDENGETNVTIQSRTPIDFASSAPDVTDYFRQACEYGTREGELDIHFVTPHTKNNGEGEGQLVTSTPEEEMVKRKAMLASMNPDQAKTPKFYCGLGQEASSISAGNHVNVFGQFHADQKDELPLFFTTGDFRTFYSEIKRRNAAGEKIFLQMNHPDVKGDLYWGDFSEFKLSKSKMKEGLNDYGLDDFAPMGCLTGKVDAAAPECRDVSAERPTVDLLQKTFANVRAASGNPFRLIEIVGPGSAKEGAQDTDGDGSPDSEGEAAFGATTNTKTTFRAVHRRKDPHTYEEGVRDWVFYLSMGFKIGPVANQDNHHMNFGSATASRTGVVAANLKESTVLDALAARHVFASEDKNAKVLLSQITGTTRRIMGDTVKATATKTKLNIGYYDPDAKDSAAKVRLYYYRASDPVPFGPGAKSKSAYHTVAFDAKKRITLPSPTAEERSPNDLVSIKNGEVLALDLPLSKGVQWVFAEIVQDGDLDKIWTAPIWIEKK